jgi:hypothetical protein
LSAGDALCSGRYGAIQRGLRRAHDHQRLHFVRRLRQRRLQHGQQGIGHQRRLGPAVSHHVRVVVGSEQGVDSDRHDAGIQRTEKGDRPFVAVVHQQQHAFLAPQARGQQRGGHAADAIGQLAVAQAAMVVDERGLGGAAGVAHDQVLREVEALARGGDMGCGHGEVSSGGAGGRPATCAVSAARCGWNSICDMGQSPLRSLACVSQ